MNRDTIIRLMDELKETMEFGVVEPGGSVFWLDISDTDLLETALSAELVNHLQHFDTPEEALRSLRYAYGSRVDR
jgi:hypothetical protein